MITILNEDEFQSYNLVLDSHFSEFKDFWDSIYFILRCEEYYNLEIFDSEVIFIESKDLSFKEIEELFLFIRDGFISDFIHQLILNNINDLKSIRSLYSDYITNNREQIISSLLKREIN